MKEIGKLDITVTEGSLHIEGYPTARRFVKLPAEPFGQKIGDLRLHQSDLIFCEQAMQLFGLHLQTSVENQSNENNLMNRTIFWIAILTKFLGCFKKSKARMRLEKDDVFKDSDDARGAFDYFEALRDKHIVHDENPLNIIAVGVVLGESNKIIDIVSLKLQADTASSQSDAQNLYNLITHTLKYVALELDTSLQDCFKFLNNLESDDLEKMYDVKVDWPNASKIVNQNRK